jgi:hypothetical protein
MKYNETKKAYEEILGLINKYKDIVLFSYGDLERRSKQHLFGLKLQEKYGLEIKPENIGSLDYNRFGEYMSIGQWGEKYNRTISWLDNGKQPEDEVLLQLSFPTGAHIFGDDYPTPFFQEFFNELKTYKPDYIDTTNKNLYWKIKNSKDIFNGFPAILKKYYERNKEDAKKRKIEKLHRELELLTINKQ